MAGFQDKSVLVLGGSRGIGAAIVRRFASEGAAVSFTYAGSREAAERLAAETGATPALTDSADRDAVIARVRGEQASAAYDGRGICYLEFGDDRVAKVDVTFRAGQAPAGQFEEPTEGLAADKAEFGRSRIQRWFGREWSAH